MFLCWTTVAGKVAFETVVRSVGRNLDLSSVGSMWLNHQECEVVVRADGQPRFCGVAYVVHVNDKMHESSFHILHDSDVSDVDECQTSLSAGSFKQCAGTRSSDRKNRKRKSCIGNRHLKDEEKRWHAEQVVAMLGCGASGARATEVLA